MRIVFHRTSHADVTSAGGHPWVRTVTFRGQSRAVVGSLPCGDPAYAVAHVNAHGGSVTAADLEVVDCTRQEAAAIDSALFDVLRAAQAQAVADRRAALRVALANATVNVGGNLVLAVPSSAQNRMRFFRALKHALDDIELGRWDQTDGE